MFCLCLFLDQTFATSAMSLDAKKKERVKVHFPGALDSHFSQVLEIREKMEPIDTFRVMDTDGKVLDSSLEPKVKNQADILVFYFYCKATIVGIIACL